MLPHSSLEASFDIPEAHRDLGLVSLANEILAVLLDPQGELVVYDHDRIALGDVVTRASAGSVTRPDESTFGR